MPRGPRGAVLRLLGVLVVAACGESTGPAGSPGPVVVSTVVTPPTLDPGQFFTASVTATAPAGDRMTWVKMEVSGVLTAADSAQVGGSNSGTIAHVYQVPFTAPNGSVTVVGSGRTAKGLVGIGQIDVAVSDTVAPQLDVSLPGNPSTLQPGDTLRVSLNSHDNASLRYALVRISGAFTYTDSADANGSNVTRTLTLPIPSSARLGTPITVSAEAKDYAGNHASRSLTPLGFNDFTAPKISAQTTGGRDGIAFAPGQTLTLRLSATDNYKLVRAGYVFSAPGSGGDSTTLAGGTYSHDFVIPITTGWIGTPRFTAFAEDSSGHRATVYGTITVSSRTRRAIVSVPLADAVRDAAVDDRRGLVYLSVPATRSVRVLDAVTGSFGSDYTLPQAPGGIDLSASGDSLLVAQTGGPSVRLISLLTGAQDTVQVLSPGDTRSVANLRVLADNTMLVTITFAGSGYGGSIAEYKLATRTQGSRLTVTEAVPLARSGNGQKAVAIIDDSCCPLDGVVYDVGRGWGSGQGTVSYYGVTVALDYTGDLVLVQSSLFSGSLGSLGDYTPQGASPPAVLAADGLSAFWATPTGVTQVQLSDGAVLDSFTLGAQPRQLYLSPNGLTLVAVTSGMVHVIDLW